MPRRTNTFQKLAFLLKQRLAPIGAVVTESEESEEFLDQSTGEPQEADITIRFSCANIPVIISIECTELTRDAKGAKATKEWVSEMWGKHLDLPTNKLVLASRYGFTEQALQKAAFHGIDTIFLDDLDADSVERIIDTNILSIKTWSLTPTKVSISVPGDDKLSPEEVEILPDHLIFDISGNNVAIAKTLVENLLIAPKSREHFAAHAEPRLKNFAMSCQAPTEAATGKPIYLRKDTPTYQVLRRIDVVNISGDIKVEVMNAALQHGTLQGSTIAWGTIAYLAKKAVILGTRGQTGDVQFSFGYL